MPTEQRQAVLAEALKTIREIQEPLSRAEALRGLAPQLSTVSLAEALMLAREIRDPGFRTEALASLASQLPEEQRATVLAEALGAAGAISDERKRVRVLMRLAPHLSGALLDRALGESLAGAQAIRDEFGQAPAEARAWVLTELVTQLSTWAHSQPAVAYIGWQAALHALAVYPRRAFLEDLRALIPFGLVLVSDSEQSVAATDIFHAIQDVTSWWP